MQGVAYCPQLFGANMLDAALNFHQRFSGDFHTAKLQNPHQLGLPQTSGQTDFSDVVTNVNTVLFDFFVSS